MRPLPRSSSDSGHLVAAFVPRVREVENADRERSDDTPERDGYIPGVPCWVDTSQPDPEASLGFYSGLFGWQFENVMPEGSEGRYFIGRLRGGDMAAVGSIPEGVPPMAMWNTYIWVESADETATKVRDAGGGVAVEPFDVMDAGRMAVVTDPEGAACCLWQARQHRGAGVVNEHGSLNFNALASRDLEGAKAFYGAVFGWTTLSMPAGVMWTLPGYGDHLEEASPGLRQQMAQMGAPEGFIDVVAALNPIGDDDPATPAHWNVTFAVDDVDATATRAREIGGEVSPGQSMPRGPGWPSSRTRRERASSPASSFPRTGISRRSRPSTASVPVRCPPSRAPPGSGLDPAAATALRRSLLGPGAGRRPRRARAGLHVVAARRRRQRDRTCSCSRTRCGRTSPTVALTPATRRGEGCSRAGAFPRPAPARRGRHPRGAARQPPTSVQVVQPDVW